jgi:predicted flap endonuclease-1-like 5' DNA nuclease
MPSDALPRTESEVFLPEVVDIEHGERVVRARPQGVRGRKPMIGASNGHLADPGAMTLHVSKLRGISFDVRAKLKRYGVTYTHQLLAAAGSAAQRRQFAAQSGIEEETLGRLTRRADLARIKGVGAIFADMLELLGVDRVGTLAQQDPVQLHDTLYQLNATERFARRAPTPEEVADWVAQARALPKLVREDA